ncbi:hypothetical protein D3C81_2101780 [compost metagenome]
MAPLPAARAAPLRYHHCGVSPAGWATAGTSTAIAPGALAAGVVLAQAPSSKVAATAVTRQVVRDMDARISHVKRAFIMQNPARHADDTLIFRARLVPPGRLG